MKHLFLLGLVTLLLVSCSKQESLIGLETLDPKTNDQSELSFTKSGLTSQDDVPIYYKYFLDEIPVGEGTFTLDDPNLVVHLTAKNATIDGREVLQYELHAFNDELFYYEWALGQGILAEKAINMTNTLSQYSQNGQINTYFQQNIKLPQAYIKYVDELIFNTRKDVIGTVDVAPVSITTYEGKSDNSIAWSLGTSYAPVLPSFVNNEISSIDASIKNMYFPTILFDDEFYMNRLNPVIWNVSDRPIIFEGPLENLDDKVSSIF